MSSFTPGPWAVNPADRREIIANGEPMVICRTSVELYQKAAPANARLIAAAPDLLDACEGLLGLLTLIEMRPDVHPELIDALNASHRVAAARAAIAKATGEAQ